MRLTCIRDDNVHLPDPFFDELCSGRVIGLVARGYLEWDHGLGILCGELRQSTCGRERPNPGEDDSVRASGKLPNELQAESTTSTGNYGSVSDAKRLDLAR